MPKGNPRITSNIENYVISQIAEGIPLRELLRQEEIPHTTWYAHVNRYPPNHEIHERIARARELGEEVIAAETLEIADDGSNDWMERHDKDGECIGYQLNGEHVQRSKLRVDTRLKLLAKWNPRKWGEKIDLTSDGEKIGSVADAIAAGNKRLAELEKRDD